MCDRFDWVEIIEPRSHERMYANLSTGECVWEPPPNVAIKLAHSDQWWELFDLNTSRFYYYNTTSQKTVWHRPLNCDIIPLAKLQTLKQRSNVREERRRNMREESTQTAHLISTKRDSSRTVTSPLGARKQRVNQKKLNIETNEFGIDDESGIQRVDHTSPNSSIYGYVHKELAPQKKEPIQRSLVLESPQSDMACDILLDLERSRSHDFKAHEFGKGPDLMSRSYHSHYQSGNLHEQNQVRGGHDALPQSLAAQVTPRPKPRAFPRTNPAFVTLQRPDGFATYRRVNDRQPGAVVFEQPMTAIPVLQDTSGNPMLRQNRLVNQSFDSTDGSRPSEHNPVPSSMTSNSSVRSREGRRDNTKSSKSNLAQNELLMLRRNSEPYYVNLPSRERDETGNLEAREPVYLVETREPVFFMETSDRTSKENKSTAMSISSCDRRDDLDDEISIQGTLKDDDEDMSSVFSSTPPLVRSSNHQPWQLMETEPRVEMRHHESSQPDEQPAELRHPAKKFQPSGNMSTVQHRHGQHPEVMTKCYSESYGQGLVTRPTTSHNVRDNKMEPPHSLMEFDVEEFATKHLNDHRKGFLGKPLSAESLLTWNKDVIKKPIIRTQNRLVKKEAPEMFKRIQMYMGDRPLKGTTVDQAALEVVSKGWSTVELRDEIYIQLCRQTTKNPQTDSLVRGLELMCICLSFFPPSQNFLPYIQQHFVDPSDPQIENNQKAFECIKQYPRRLEKAVLNGAKKGVCPPTREEFEQSRKSMYVPSMFGSLLTEVMEMQSERFPKRQLPWIQTVLSEEVLRLNGAQAEGIFRIPGDIDEVNAMKIHCDQWNLPSNCRDPSIPASLLKLWYRELYEPLIPFDFYLSCIDNCEDPIGIQKVIEMLPDINRLVLMYFVRFLQVFAAQENARVTKMDINNLSMVMAPNFLHSRITDPRLIFENMRKEMSFVRTLITHLDTSEMEGVI